MDRYRRGDLVFEVIDEGPPNGPVVVLLHGFPQSNAIWDAVIRRLTAQGYRCLAPNQRGYSPGARPTRRRDYRMPELVNDFKALIDTANLERVHLVGHDSGAGVAWSAASTLSDRLASLTTLSVPHPAAFAQALTTPRQALASWYIYFFQLPWLPERLLIGPNGTATGLSKMLQNSHQTPDRADRDARIMASPGSFTAALNWYRALPFTNARPYFKTISFPTMFVWSDGDTSVLLQGARRCARHVSGDFRFETLHGVSHWIPEEKPDTVADLLLEWFAAHPI